MKRLLLAFVLVGAWGALPTRPRPRRVISISAPSRMRPSMRVRNGKIVPTATYATTKRYKVLRPSGWYFVAVDGSKEILIKKNEAKLLLATPLTATSFDSNATRQLAHDYFKPFPKHIAYEYELLTPERAKQYADRALRGIGTCRRRRLRSVSEHRHVPSGNCRVRKQLVPVPSPLFDGTQPVDASV